MTLIAPEPTTNNTQPTPAVDWRTTDTDRGTFTTAHIGHVTVDGEAASVHLDLNPDWFARGRAKGRTEDILTGPGVVRSPGFCTVIFYVEHADVDPAPYLAAAPATLTR